MARISAKGNEFAIVLSRDEFNALGFAFSKEYEFRKVKDGIWVMLEKEIKVEQRAEPKSEPKKEPVDAVEKKILEFMKKKPLHQRVEGKFEKSLSQQEQKKFSEMLKQRKVVKFMLSKQKYKKAVYKLKEDAEKDFKKGIGEEIKVESADTTPAEEKRGYDLHKDGVAVFGNEAEAKEFSRDHFEQMKDHSIIGIKSFDGNFYFLFNGVYETKSKQMLDYLAKNKTAHLSELAGITKSAPMAKAIIEFLKEEGLVIEKRKEFYEAV